MIRVLLTNLVMEVADFNTKAFLYSLKVTEP